jgi:protein TonB
MTTMLLLLLAQAATPPPPPPSAQSSAPSPGPIISYTDYPPEALKQHKQGVVRAKLWISKEGRVYRCRILKSSGDQALDNATCNILTARARFTPARDQFGNPTEDTVVAPPITWKIED